MSSRSERDYEPGRLMRASRRAVKRLGGTRFRVAGTHAPYWDVDLSVDPPCYCPDSEFHGRGCLHELAARLASGDMQLIQALGDMLYRAQQHLAAHTHTTTED